MAMSTSNWVNHSTFKNNWKNKSNIMKPSNKYSPYNNKSTDALDIDNDENNLIVNLQDLPSLPNRQLKNIVLNKSAPNIFPAWSVYFPDEEYSEDSEVLKIIQLFYEFLKNVKDNLNMQSVEFKKSFELDFSLLLTDKNIGENFKDLQEQFKLNPEKFLNCLSAAAFKMLKESDEDNRIFDEVQYAYSRLQCRVVNFDSPTPLRLLKANFYGKLITVKGTVVRTSSSRPICLQMAYQCSLCANIKPIRWPGGKCVQPNTCETQNCRSKTFYPLRNNAKTLTVDFQVIRLHEQNDEIRELGRIPRTVECELMADLVDSCMPGDIVTITGIVKVTQAAETEKRQKQRDQCTFILCIEANSVVNSRSPTCASAETFGGPSLLSSASHMEYSTQELYAIEHIQAQPKLFRLLTGSLCPSIYGHEVVKAGLLLGLFGGTQRYHGEKNQISIRADPHVLIVGDPGLGKSQMLQAVSNLSPRSVYVCANSSTMAGLTVSISKDACSGESLLDAGALVLADQGCCCIDEFDKLGSHHQALLEAMEQQTISIAKAGIVCSLPARTSIIAAANPSGGHYNKAKTVSENLRMNSAILSRFDLVFILLDKPDEDLDSRLSEHVMALHAGKKRSLSSTQASSRNTSIDEELNETNIPISQKLKITVHDGLDLIPAQLLRKYIGYARQYVHPILSPEASQVIQKFYLDLRQKHKFKDSTPITRRQLESICRLAEARARMELREEVNLEDAEDVIGIMKCSMIDTFSDESGRLDFQRSQHGSGSSSRAQGKKFICLLQRTADARSSCMFSTKELTKIIKDASLKVKDTETFLTALNDQGYLLKKGSNMYELQAI